MKKKGGKRERRCNPTVARFCTGLPSIDRNDNVQYVGKAISYESNVQQVENVALPTNRVTLELLDQTDTPGFHGILFTRGLSCLSRSNEK